MSLQNFKFTKVLFEVCLTKSKRDLIYGIIIVVVSFSSFVVSMVSCRQVMYNKNILRIIEKVIKNAIHILS